MKRKRKQPPARAARAAAAKRGGGPAPATTVTERDLLNALPAHIALLDDTGRIAMVNRAWREFARANRGLPRKLNEGVNYLEVCRRSARNGDAKAREVLAGLQQVLSGKLARYECEYTCDSPNRARWFQMQASRSRALNGVLVIHTNITAFKRSEAAAQSAARFPEEDPNPVMRVAASGQLLYANPTSKALLRHWRTAPGRKVPPELRKVVRAVLTSRRVVDWETSVRDHAFSLLVAPSAGQSYVNIYGRDITDRKAAEAQLRDLSQHLSYHVDHSPLAVIEWDANMRLTRWSGEAEHIFGWTAEEVLGKRMDDFRWIHAEDQSRVQEVTRDLQAGANPRRVSANRNYRKDGSVIHCEWFNSLLIDARGKVQSILSLVLDVSERKQTEEALRASESRYRTLFETMTEGFVLLEMIRDESGEACDLRYLAANPAFERQTGMRAEAVVGQKLGTVFPGAEALWVKRYDRVEVTGEPAQFEAWFSPLQRYFDVRAFRVEPGRIGVVFQDVTERRKADQERYELHQRLEALMEAVPVGVSFSADASCRQITGNAAMLAQVEARPEDNLSASAAEASAPGRQLRFFVGDRQIQASELPLQRAVAENRPTTRMEFEVLLPSGRRWSCEGWGSPIRDPDGKVIGGVAVTVDITQRKLFEAELERLVRQRTRELQETTDQLNAFVYSLAHDLRAPLRAQAAFAILLLEDFGSVLGETGRNYARRIADSAERQGVLLAGLLKHISLARSELPLERVELLEALKQVQTDLVLEVQRTGAVVTVGRMEGAVKANAASLHLILANLLSNAIKFVAAGVRPEVKVWTEQREGWVLVSVADNGLGIPATHTHKLFGLFQRLHSGPQYPGTGIGLALVKKAVERLGGRVGVESEPGKGSRFWVELQSA